MDSLDEVELELRRLADDLAVYARFWSRLWICCRRRRKHRTASPPDVQSFSVLDYHVHVAHETHPAVTSDMAQKTGENATQRGNTSPNAQNWRIGAGPWENCRECGQARPIRVLKDGVCPRCRMPVLMLWPDNPLLENSQNPAR